MKINIIKNFFAIIKSYCNPFNDYPLRKDRSIAIDRLRAIFAVWVLVVHLLPWAARAQGEEAVPSTLIYLVNFLRNVFQPVGELHPAVLGFIVLSGYCIHRSGFRLGSFDLAHYTIRRIFRILPVYFAAIFAGMVLYFICAHKDLGLVKELSSTMQLSVSGLSARLLGYAAIFPWFYTSSFQGNGPLNTVMVEIWLYVLYPVVFLCFFKMKYLKNAFWIFIFCILFTESMIFLFLLSEPNTQLYSWFQNASIVSFFTYWWIGCLFVSPTFFHKTKKLSFIIFLLWGVLTFLLMNEIFPYLGLVLAEVRKILFALMIGQFIYTIDSLKFKTGRILGVIGQSGYSLYAFHAPITYTLCLYGLPWWLIFFINIICGLLIYHLYEKPFTNLGRTLLPRFSKKKVLRP